MYNKIASIILNSGKNQHYASEVFVSQPNSEKEKLAGKIFVLAEIEGKKNESQKIINFLINFFDYNYYGDDKLLLKESLSDVSIEDIFESVLAKINKGLLEFLQNEKLRIDPLKTNITLGIIYKNEIHFSNFGKNKTFLIFKKQGDYEMLNVESHIVDNENNSKNKEKTVNTKIFQSVINGKIPSESYFILINETLPEYLSNKELINIITKLPPMVAAEQIKNSLQRINSFAPFIGIIIKSTLGPVIRENEEDYDDNHNHIRDVYNEPAINNPGKKAHNSISNLNYTEQKTEQMLSSAGTVSLKKIKRKIDSIFQNSLPQRVINSKITKLKNEDEDENKILIKNNYTKKDSFIIKDRLVFKKKKSSLIPKIGGFFKYLSVIFTTHFWLGSYKGIIKWIKSLNKKDKILISSLSLCFIILIVSIVITTNGQSVKIAKQNFDEVIASVNKKQDQIDAYLLYDNEDAAVSLLKDTASLLKDSVAITKEQEDEKQANIKKLSIQQDKIEKITEISNFDEVTNLKVYENQAKADSLALVNNNLYIADNYNGLIYLYNQKSKVVSDIDFKKESSNLGFPTVSDDSLYYLSEDKIVAVTGKKIDTYKVLGDEFASDSPIAIYNNRLYLLDKINGQIYKYAKSGNTFSARAAWLKTDDNFSSVSDMQIDGKITLADTNSGPKRFFKNEDEKTIRTPKINPDFRADQLILGETNLYFLDALNKRIVILDNNGDLIKQYRLVKDNIQDFSVDEANKNIYILSDSIIYKFSI